MSAQPLSAEQVLSVATALMLEHSALDASAWGASAYERQRSSISRSYYSVFLTVKSRVSPLLTNGERDFPKGLAHLTVRKALKSVLGSRNRISTRYDELLDERESADYDLTGDFDGARAAQSQKKARDVRALLGDLSADTWKQIARKIGAVRPDVSAFQNSMKYGWTAGHD